MTKQYPSRILIIIHKNTSTLDYVLPIIWRLRETEQQAQISLFFPSISNRKILRQSTYYHQLLMMMNVHIYDYLDFLRKPFGLLSKLYRRIIGNSIYDGKHETSPNNLVRYWQTTRSRLEQSLLQHIEPNSILSFFDPDLILLDHRSNNEMLGWESINSYIENHQIRTVLLPHAPHHTGTTYFTPYSKQTILPSYADYWMPFFFDQPFSKIDPKYQSQFFYAGYPGLDYKWLQWVKRNNFAKPRKNHRFNLLLIIRKFLPPMIEPPTDHDPYIFTSIEFLSILKTIKQCIDQSSIPIHLIVKPHPSNDFSLVKQTFKDLEFDAWEISYDPVYSLLNRVDAVISLYSTTLLIPAMSGIPVALLHTRVQDDIHRWSEMKEMYSGLTFYLPSLENLVDVFDQFIETAQNKEFEKDIYHLRKFYPDGSVDRILERIQQFPLSDG